MKHCIRFLKMPPATFQVPFFVPFFATRLEDSAKRRIKPTAGLTQPVCDELAASNGQTARKNDGGMVFFTDRDENFSTRLSPGLRARKIDEASLGIG